VRAYTGVFEMELLSRQPAPPQDEWAQSGALRAPSRSQLVALRPPQLHAAVCERLARLHLRLLLRPERSA